MDFEIIGRISNIEKLKGVALVLDRETGESYWAEIHWYEATGIGRKELKIKRPLEGR